MLRLLGAFLFLLSSVPLSPWQQARVKHIEEKLLAPCCYSQSIAQHTSDIAAQMRGEVTDMVAKGMSDAQIIAHYKAIYGDQILIVPEGRTGTVLFLLPVVLFILALGILVLVLRRMLRAGARSAGQAAIPKVSPSSSALLEQIERETGDVG